MINDSSNNPSTILITMKSIHSLTKKNQCLQICRWWYKYDDDDDDAAAADDDDDDDDDDD
jgi:hypothetical protein